jgi:hypothetical protein
MIVQCLVCDHCKTMTPVDQLSADTKAFVATIILKKPTAKSQREKDRTDELSFCNKDCFVEFIKTGFDENIGFVDAEGKAKKKRKKNSGISILNRTYAPFDDEDEDYT